MASEENELTQLKIKYSHELKRYVSQNISSNSWNSTVNKVGVLAKFVFSQALLYLFNLVVKSFSGKCDKVSSPLVVKRFIDDGSNEKDLIRSRSVMNKCNSFTHSISRVHARNLYIVDTFQTNTFSYTTKYAKKKKKRKNKVGTFTTIFAVGSHPVPNPTLEGLKKKTSFARIIARCTFQCSLIQTFILVQISVFIDRLRVVFTYVLHYMHSY